MKPVIYKPLQHALFDAAAESLNEYVQCRDIDGACDPDTLRARAKFYALMGVIEEAENHMRLRSISQAHGRKGDINNG